MKKADVLVIIIVLFLAIGFYAIYFIMNPVIDMETSEVVVVYDNIEVYSVQYAKDLNVVVSLESKNNILYVKIDDNEEEIKEFKINNKHEIINIVEIEYGHIHMTEANCENGLCLNMGIVGPRSPQIFCTNNVSIRLKSNEDFNFNIITG